jgi:hypothetical protein
MNWFDRVWGLRRDPVVLDPPFPHICELPYHWPEYVAVGTIYTCPVCKRWWWLNEQHKWQSEVEE